MEKSHGNLIEIEDGETNKRKVRGLKIEKEMYRLKKWKWHGKEEESRKKLKK